jgi:hypothetical protein
MVHLKPPGDDFVLASAKPIGLQRPPPTKKRRILITLLGIQLCLLFLVFPLLILYFENEQPQPEFETADGIELSSQPGQPYSYINGLYWSLITPVALNSIDPWPQTGQGWFIVRLSDATKLLTVCTSVRLFHDILLARRSLEISPFHHIRKRRSKDEEWDRPAFQPNPFLKRQPPVPPNLPVQKIATILVYMLLVRDQRQKDTDDTEEDPPSTIS